MKIGLISPGDPITKLALEGLMQGAPILQDIEFYSRGGNSDNLKANKTGANPTVFRALNASNTASSAGATDVPVLKKIVSFDSGADVILEDRNLDPLTELASQTKADAIEMGYALQDAIFNADSATANNFDGIIKLCPAGNVKVVATNGLPMPLGNSDTNMTAQQTALEELLKLIACVRGGASHVYMNEFLKIRTVSVAKNLGYYSQSIDELGQTIEKIGNTIIRGAGYKSDGTPLLPLTETVGSSNVCSRIICVRFGEQKDLTALTSKGVVGRFAGQFGNKYVNNVNLDMAFGLQNTSAIVISKGWRLA